MTEASLPLIKLRFPHICVCRDRITALVMLMEYSPCEPENLYESSKIKPKQPKAEGMDGEKLNHDENVLTPNSTALEGAIPDTPGIFICGIIYCLSFS